MAMYHYRQMRKVLKASGFNLIRSGKHEIWEKIKEDEDVLEVMLSHKGKHDIPRGTFYKILKQISEEEFRDHL